MPTVQVSLRLDDLLHARALQCADAHNQSLSQVLRDGLALLLADPTRYETLLLSRMHPRPKPPTPAQQVAGEQYALALATVDLEQILERTRGEQ